MSEGDGTDSRMVDKSYCGQTQSFDVIYTHCCLKVMELTAEWLTNRTAARLSLLMLFILTVV